MACKLLVKHEITYESKNWTHSHVGHICPSSFKIFHEGCWNTLMIAYINLFADPYYFERKGLYIGQGTTVMSRAGIFRASEGVAVDMVHRIYKLPSFRGMLLFFWLIYQTMFSRKHESVCWAYLLHLCFSNLVVGSWSEKIAILFLSKSLQKGLNKSVLEILNEHLRCPDHLYRIWTLRMISPRYFLDFQPCKSAPIVVSFFNVQSQYHWSMHTQLSMSLLSEQESRNKIESTNRDGNGAWLPVPALQGILPPRSPLKAG